MWTTPPLVAKYYKRRWKFLMWGNQQTCLHRAQRKLNDNSHSSHKKMQRYPLQTAEQRLPPGCEEFKSSLYTQTHPKWQLCFCNLKMTIKLSWIFSYFISRSSGKQSPAYRSHQRSFKKEQVSKEEIHESKSAVIFRWVKTDTSELQFPLIPFRNSVMMLLYSHFDGKYFPTSWCCTSVILHKFLRSVLCCL